MNQPHITLTRGQWTRLHNALCNAEAKAGGLFEVLKDGGEGIAALRSVREALAPAYAQDEEAFDRQHTYFESFRQTNGLRAQWSIYELDEHGFLQPHAFEGATHVVYDNHWGETGVEVNIDGCTWADLYRAADTAIQQSGDDHHVFIERFTPIRDRPGHLRLITGS
jgi:hypothetical protein